MEIDNCSALVTGGASGMGLATVKALIAKGAKGAKGARVAVLDVDQSQCLKISDELGCMAVTADVTDRQSVCAAVDQVEQSQGPIRILINCAGVGHTEPLVCDNPDVEFEAMVNTIRVNLIGTLNVTQVVANRMANVAMYNPAEDNSTAKDSTAQDSKAKSGVNTQEEKGVIIMVASGAAFDGVPGAAAYTASKGGIASMTLALARELGGQQIRVNTISPGAVATPMLAGLPTAAMESIAATIPYPKRPGEPAEFASLALHICENSYLNGAVIRLDGAHRMPYPYGDY